MPEIIQVGLNSLQQACRLAQHKQGIGADAISAVSAANFKLDSLATLAALMAYVVPRLPFYDHHIPRMTGSAIDTNVPLELVGDQLTRSVDLDIRTADSKKSCDSFLISLPVIADE